MRKIENPSEHIIRKLSELRNSVSWHIFENILMKNSFFNFIQCSYVSKNAFACFQADKMPRNTASDEHETVRVTATQNGYTLMQCIADGLILVVLYLYTKNIMNQRK